MTLQMDYGQRRLIDVVGRITGSEFPDEWVIIGSHRDAWVFGAADSVSGHVSMMSVARAMSQMMKNGWKPRRSILFVSWDGEEPGLLGSTEFVEDLANDLKAKAAVLINRDSGAGGRRSSRAARSLADAVRARYRAIGRVGPAVEDAVRPVAGARAGQVKEEDPPLAAPVVGALGSGSDYTAFLDHIGVASLDMGLNGTGDGVYHSTWKRSRVVQEVHRSALRVQRAGRAGDGRRRAALRRRAGAAVRLRVVRQTDRRKPRRTSRKRQPPSRRSLRAGRLCWVEGSRQKTLRARAASRSCGAFAC